MKSKRAWLTLSLASALAACSTTVGRDFSTDNVSQMQVGQTTTEQTISALGEPFSRNIAADGSEKWQYQFQKSSARVKGKSFIPFVGPYLNNSGNVKIDRRTLDLEFQGGVLSSCKFTIRKSDSDGSAMGGAVIGAVGGGTTQEMVCGNGSNTLQLGEGK